MDDPAHREAIAAHYLQNFGLFFYEIKKRCDTADKKKAFAHYPWRQALDPQALRYLGSKRLDAKTKWKLKLALYCTSLAVRL